MVTIKYNSLYVTSMCHTMVTQLNTILTCDKLSYTTVCLCVTLYNYIHLYIFTYYNR